MANIYKLGKINGHTMDNTNFLHFTTNLLFIKRLYNPFILQCPACLVVNPFTCDNHAFLFSCTPTGIP